MKFMKYKNVEIVNRIVGRFSMITHMKDIKLQIMDTVALLTDIDERRRSDKFWKRKAKARRKNKDEKKGGVEVEKRGWEKDSGG